MLNVILRNVLEERAELRVPPSIRKTSRTAYGVIAQKSAQFDLSSSI